MSILRKILIVFGCLLAAGLSAWLRYGDMAAARQWLANRSLPSIEASAPAPAAVDDGLSVHVAYGGTAASPRDAVLVLHFRRPDSPEETVAKVEAKVFDGEGRVVKEIGVWGVFRHDSATNASVARFVVGPVPPGPVRVAADLGSRQPIGVKRAAIELAIRDGDPVWADLVRAK